MNSKTFVRTLLLFTALATSRLLLEGSKSLPPIDTESDAPRQLVKVNEVDKHDVHEIQKNNEIQNKYAGHVRNKRHNEVAGYRDSGSLIHFYNGTTGCRILGDVNNSLFLGQGDHGSVFATDFECGRFAIKFQLRKTGFLVEDPDTTSWEQYQSISQYLNASEIEDHLAIRLGTIEIPINDPMIEAFRKRARKRGGGWNMENENATKVLLTIMKYLEGPDLDEIYVRMKPKTRDELKEAVYADFRPDHKLNQQQTARELVKLYGLMFRANLIHTDTWFHHFQWSKKFNGAGEPGDDNSLMIIDFDRSQMLKPGHKNYANFQSRQLWQLLGYLTCVCGATGYYLRVPSNVLHHDNMRKRESPEKFLDRVLPALDGCGFSMPLNITTPDLGTERYLRTYDTLVTWSNSAVKSNVTTAMT